MVCGNGPDFATLERLFWPFDIHSPLDDVVTRTVALSTLVTLCAENPLVTGEFPTWTVTGRALMASWL